MMEEATKLTESDLTGFHGSEEIYQITRLVPRFSMTEGIKYLTDKGHCHWLITDVAIKVAGTKILDTLNQHADLMICVINQQPYKVEYRDLNENLIATQRYSLIDFPFPKYEFYVMNNILLLKTEY